MNSREAFRKLADATASQWGMVTTAQAEALGVSRLVLSRLAESGELERLAHGVYRDAGAPRDEFDELRSAWLSTDPKLLAHKRLGSLADGVVVASASAAMLHGVGDLWASRHEFVTARRRQTQRPEIRYRRRRLEDRDVTLVEGLPVMVLERTVVDLLDDSGDLSLVSDALGAAVKKQRLDYQRMRELLSPLAQRHGFRPHDGDTLLERLLQTAGLDLGSIAERISANSILSQHVLRSYLRREMPSFDISHTTEQATESISQTVQETLRPYHNPLQLAVRNVTANAMPDFSKSLAELVASPALTNISHQWAETLRTSTSSTATDEPARVDQESDGDDVL